jgi:hypothetical protein
MIGIFVVAYLVLSLPATLLLWTVLMASKRLDDESQSMKSESSGRNQVFASNTETINFHSS